jgi:DNA helicase-2/ATP-dependent DNA helicase PcrA
MLEGSTGGICDKERVEEIFLQEHTVKLFYQSHLRYPCFSDNWGASKGIDDYDSVCVVLNKKSEDLYRQGRLNELPAITRNKLYVACTRARSALYFLPESLIKKFKQ